MAKIIPARPVITPIIPRILSIIFQILDFAIIDLYL